MNDLSGIPITTLIEFLERHGYSEHSRDNNHINFKKEIDFGRSSNLGSDHITIISAEEIGGRDIEQALKQAAIPNDIFIDYLRSKHALLVIRSVVAYIDVLGFTDKIKEANRDRNQLNTFLQEFHDAFGRANKQIQDNVSRKKYFDILRQSHVRVFSDNLVLIHEYSEKRQGEREIAFVIEQVAHYQLELALSGFFSRGAITSGDAYCDNQIIFGMPIITAYELETNIAKDPRVIIDDELKEELCVIIGSFYKDPDSCFLSDLIIQDCDGTWFVNYLWILKWFNDDMIDGLDLDPEYYPRHCTYYPGAINELAKHKDTILESLSCCSDDIRVRKKIEWLADYHNFFCSEYFGYESSIRIDNDSGNHRFSMPIPELIQRNGRYY